MSNPAILVEDFFRRTDLTGHTVTDFSAATGFPATRLRDWKDDRDWKANTTGTQTYHVDLGNGNDLEADTLAILKCNYKTSAPSAIRVHYSDNDVDWFAAHTTITAAIQGNRTSDYIYTKLFDGIGAHRYWRLQFGAASSAVTAREVFLGRRIEFPYGIDPATGFDPWADVPQNRVYESEKGRVVETISDFVQRLPQWRFRVITESFWDDVTPWTGFRWWWENYALLGRPAVFAWNLGEITNPDPEPQFERDTVYGVPVIQGGPTTATSIDRGYRDIKFGIRGRRSG